MTEPAKYFLKENGIFPNSHLPVLHYPNALTLLWFFPANEIMKKLQEHGWTNNWRSGIYTYNHYHSVTHEVLGVAKGRTTLLLGGQNGKEVVIEKGDVLVIPAGVAYKNLCKERDVICVGGYPEEKDFDMNYGKTGERPQTDINIAALPIPSTDPVYGSNGPLIDIWSRYNS